MVAGATSPTPMENILHPAGAFSAWLHAARESLRNGTGTDVACGECNACCRSAYFIHIQPGETKTLEALGKEALIDAPGLPAGHKLMGHDQDGKCARLIEERCTVYAHRPQTCRNYDCRVFAGAGITAGDDKPRINARVEQWRFDYPTPRDREEHEAVQAAAKFVRDHAAAFPGGRIPTDASRLAILALQVYEVFLEAPLNVEETARRVVEASRNFSRRAP
jgi:Fe-S-cluster containining protein